jgi:hypothetical protein
MLILVIMPDSWLISGIDQASTLKDAMGALRISLVGPTVYPIYMRQNKSFLAPELAASAEGRSAWQASNYESCIVHALMKVNSHTNQKTKFDHSKDMHNYHYVF